jgi:serine/threonine protein kinase
MAATRTCQKCGASFSGGALGGLCPNCVGRLAFLLEPSAGAPGDTPPPFPSGTLPRHFGDYDLLGEIARGGMGVVYKARQISLNRTVALKTILAGNLASAAEVARFRAEAEAAANLRHPNIVAIHEVGEQDGHHYFSMEYVAGQNLAQLSPGAAGRKAAWFRRVAAWLRTIAEAVQYAHEQGTLHRDLKPSNVLIDGNDQPHVTDFGLAKQSRQDLELTVSGQVLGTPGFMSPEQASGKRGLVGPQSDVYSLGAILYFLLTGQPPHTGESVPETLARALDSEPVAPRTSNRNIPRDLETICLKCLEKAPARRYASARELALDLERFINYEPIVARPISKLERFGRRCRRHPLVTALVSLLLVLLVGWVLVFYRLAQDKEARTSRMWAVEPNTLTMRSVGPVQAAAVDPKSGDYWTAVPKATMMNPAGILIRDGSSDLAKQGISLGGTNNYIPGSIDFDARHRVVWIGAQGGHSNDPIWQMDGDNYRVKDPISCGGIHGEPSAVNPATGRYYHLVSGSVPQRIDPVTLTLTKTAFGPVVGVNAAANLLYAVNPDGDLQIVDGAPDPEVVLKTVRLPFPCGLGIGVDPKRNRIYVPNRNSSLILIADGRTGEIRGEIRLQGRGARLMGINKVICDPEQERIFALAADKDYRLAWLFVIQGRQQRAIKIPGRIGDLVWNGRYHQIYVWSGGLDR